MNRPSIEDHFTKLARWAEIVARTTRPFPQIYRWTESAEFLRHLADHTINATLQDWPFGNFFLLLRAFIIYSHGQKRFTLLFRTNLLTLGMMMTSHLLLWHTIILGDRIWGMIVWSLVSTIMRIRVIHRMGWRTVREAEHEVIVIGKSWLVPTKVFWVVVMRVHIMFVFKELTIVIKRQVWLRISVRIAPLVIELPWMPESSIRMVIIFSLPRAILIEVFVAS